MTVDPRDYLVVAVLLFSIGVAGFLTRRNLLVVFLSIELMLNAGGLALLTFARVRGSMDGHVLFFLILALAAAESAVGLSLFIALYRRKHAVEAEAVAELKG
ncbi:MAG TPA: NADH-quinone oxidoreductase subunit NuoK [Planctomycetota bacterium]|nr:NADH-quinone oxidoreductase subunit NuoK [Planctomycetota bacterium]